MSINYKKTVAVLAGTCEIEEAETLQEWLLKNRTGKLNLKHLKHPHTALLQVMMALQPTVSIWPEDETLALLLQPLITANKTTTPI